MPCNPNKMLGIGCDECMVGKPRAKRWLIINLGALGDVLRSTAILAGVFEDDPRAEVTWITFHPDVLPKSVKRVVFDTGRIAALVATEQFDIAVNFDKDLYAASLLRQVDAEKKCGFVLNPATGRIKAANAGAEHKLAVGVDNQLAQNDTQSYIWELYQIAELEYRRAPYATVEFQSLPLPEPFLRPLKDHPKPWIVLAPGCSDRWPMRRWPWTHWRDLIRSLGFRLADGGKGTVFLVGGSAEQSLLAQLELQNGQNGNLRVVQMPILPIPSLLRFLSETEVVVCPVSFLLHAALATTKPRVVLLNNIFNANEFELYDRGQILEPTPKCECFYGYCPAGPCQRSCMDDILPEKVSGVVVDEVMQAVREGE
jgi:heptosyltransferase-2